MITLFQIDKSGSDIFEKDYSIVLILNKKNVYGINIPQKIKDELMHQFRIGNLKIISTSEKAAKNRFRIRFHIAVIIKLVERALYDLGKIEEVAIELCNDFDGHFHEMRDMIFKHFSRIIPELKTEDIIIARFPKPSLIDEVGKAFRRNDKEKLKRYNSVKLNSEELFEIKKTMGYRTLKGAVCKAPCFLDDPRLKTLELLPHSKECGFKSMDIIKK